MKAFDIQVNGKIVDYRIGKALDLGKIQEFFEKRYEVLRIWQAGRHVLGKIKKDDKKFFLKLATTEGISHLTKIEYEWNIQFNNNNPRSTSSYWVPQNFDSGLYEDNLFYIVTDTFDGQLLSERPEKAQSIALIQKHLPAIIEFSEVIQDLDIAIDGSQQNHQEFFLAKTRTWYEAIHEDIRISHKVHDLLDIARGAYHDLEKKSRHGDFTPWHLYILENRKLGLIDGEHARGNGVEYYDIAYFIQRVFCILENPDLAKNILSVLKNRKYDSRKLQTVLAARGIGGFLDESLKEKPNYVLCNDFRDFVSSIH